MNYPTIKFKNLHTIFNSSELNILEESLEQNEHIDGDSLIKLHPINIVNSMASYYNGNYSYLNLIKEKLFKLGYEIDLNNFSNTNNENLKNCSIDLDKVSLNDYEILRNSFNFSLTSFEKLSLEKQDAINHAIQNLNPIQFVSIVLGYDDALEFLGEESLDKLAKLNDFLLQLNQKNIIAYHGSSQLFENFSNEYLLKDYSNAAVTAGFYFSTDIDDAIGYSFDRNNKNYGYLYEITVNPDNFIHLDRNLELLDNSQVINAINHSFSNNTNFLIELLKSEQYLDVLWDFDDLSQYGDDISLMNYIEKTLLPDIANQYLERFTDKNGNINMLKILNMIGNDFYNGDTESINKKFIQITSKSGFLVDYNKDVNNLNFVTNEKHKFHFVFLDADEVNKRLKQVKQIDYKKNVSNNDVGYDLNSLPKKESNKRKLIKFKKK